MSDWVSIDYPGWEQVDFQGMKWKFTQPDFDVDGRDLKRISATEWMITDDYGEWQNYEMGNGETECLECFYQSYLKKVKAETEPITR